MRVIIIVGLLVLLSGLFGVWFHQAQDAGPDIPQGKLESLSFAPFRSGQSPLKEIFPSTAQIEQDLRLMARTTHAIRTYASDKGLRQVPLLAARHGLSVTQGAWLGYSKLDNAREVKALIAAANSYQHTVKRVIVGNEVLLREEMKPQELITYIRQVKGAVKQPVSYADVWSMYMKYPQLIREVDYITIHILPYWEDEPVSVDKAARHIEQVYLAVRKQADKIAPGKPILIGEAGWPSMGRQRGGALPGRVNAARFTRGLIESARKQGFDYNIVEAFDQPWKSELEGTVGANWGLFNKNRIQHYPLTGLVIEDPHWPERWLTVSFLLLAATAVFYRHIQHWTTARQVLGIVLLWAFLSLYINTLTQLWASSYNISRIVQMFVVCILQFSFIVLLVQRVYRLLNDRRQHMGGGRHLYIIYVLFALLAVYKSYGLAEWGRYLDFPSIMLSIPVAGLLGLVVVQCFVDRRFSRRCLNIHLLFGNEYRYGLRDKVLGGLVVIMAIAVFIGENRAFILGRDMVQAYPEFSMRLQQALGLTVSNGQLLIWVACLLVLALPLLVSPVGRSDRLSSA